MTTVASILASKPRPFNFIEPDALVKDALQMLGAVNMSYLIVMHEQHFMGIFCEHDYCKNVAMRGWDPNVCRVADTMTSNLPTSSPEDSVEGCIRLFNAHRVRYLPVFDEFRFVGVITNGDVFRSLLRDGARAFDHVGAKQQNPEWYGQVS